ncbi:protease inhibitor I42 family protein [Methanothrix sp.]|uniref:protease inhibitor I42 family protein n=1 Tax=Methanothrix sp. TaxID=90426 RepID=UPI003BB7AE3E
MGKVIISESDHEKVVDAKVGDEIEITLPNNEAVKHYWGIGAGQSWSKGASSVLEFHKEAIADIKDGREGGFGGSTTFRWLVRSPGKAIIELLLKASGEPETAAHDRFKVTIIVS